MGGVVIILAVAVGAIMAFAGAEFCARALRSIGRGALAPVGALAGALAASAPEVLFAVRAQMDGVPDLVMGLAAGSLIANALLAATLAAAGAKTPANRTTKALGLWTALGAGVLIAASLDNVIGPIEGSIMLAGALVAGVVAALGARADGGDRPHQPLGWSVVGLIGGAALLVSGAVLAVDAALTPTAPLGGLLITGLLVLGLAAALPEITAAWSAARAGEGPMALQNVLAGTAISAFAVAGAAAMVAPVTVERGFLGAPAVAMVGAAALLAVLALTGGRLPRWAPLAGVPIYVALMAFFVHAAAP